MISKLKKFKGRSFAELTERGRQKALTLAERFGGSGDLEVPNDTAFVRLFGNAADAEGLFKRFRNRETLFYSALRDRAASVSALRSYFPDEEAKIVGQADRLISGVFDLLGHRALDFGRPVPDWHLDPVSGKRSPLRHWSRIGETDPAETGDKKIVWELNRHQYFTVLGRAYWLTSDEKYAETFAEHLRAWIDKNPPKMGVNWMSSLEIAYRSISWIWAYHFFRDSPAFEPGLFLKLLKGLYLNARHLQKHLSTYSSPNTHLTGEALGLYFIGGFLREIDEASRWTETGYDILIDALEYQIREDGGYVEQATQYHRYTADIYLSLYIHRRNEGLPVADPHERKLRKMLEFLAHITQPNGETPLIGDDDGGRLHFLDGRPFADFRSTLAVGAAVLDDGRLKFIAGDASPEVLWLLGPTGLAHFESMERTSPDEGPKAFERTGWYVVRDGWNAESNFALIDCGPHGFRNGGHAHADALGFVMSVNGRPVFIDSGTYVYTGDANTRDHFRSTSAHNCLTVDGESSSIADGPFSWKSTTASKVLEWSTGEGRTLLRGTHDGYRRFGIEYEREFEFSRDFQLTLRDKVENASGRDFRLSYILAPYVKAEIVDCTSVTLRAKGGNEKLLTIVTKVIEAKPGEPGSWRIEPVRISPRYGELVATTKLVFSLIRGHDFQVESSFVIG